MGRRWVDRTVTVLLPEALGDVQVEALRDGLREVAGDHACWSLELDARNVRAISTAGLGLLAAVQLLVTRRGATLAVVRCTPAIQRQLALVRVPATLDRPLYPQRSASATRRHDWTPWWSSAAANA